MKEAKLNKIAEENITIPPDYIFFQVYMQRKSSKYWTKYNSLIHILAYVWNSIILSSYMYYIGLS